MSKLENFVNRELSTEEILSVLDALLKNLPSHLGENKEIAYLYVLAIFHANKFFYEHCGAGELPQGHIKALILDREHLKRWIKNHNLDFD